MNGETDWLGPAATCEGRLIDRACVGHVGHKVKFMLARTQTPTYVPP